VKAVLRTAFTYIGIELLSSNSKNWQMAQNGKSCTAISPILHFRQTDVVLVNTLIQEISISIYL